MYKINPLPRKVLITSDEVIAAAPIEGNPGIKNIQMAIQIAEDRFIKNSVCLDLYNEFREQKNELVTEVNKGYLETLFPTGTILALGSFVNAIEFCDEWYINLWNEHIWKLLAECVLYVATPTNWSKFSANGEMLSNPKSITNEGGGSASIELGDLKWKMDKLMQDRIDPLIAATQEYIYYNRAHFGKFNCMSFSRFSNDRYDENGLIGSNNGISYKRKTAWIHGIYDRRTLGCRDKGRDNLT